MIENEKIALLEGVLNTEAGTLEASTELNTLDDWDSLARLSLIALLDSKFRKKINSTMINQLKTISDILILMN